MRGRRVVIVGLLFLSACIVGIVLVAPAHYDALIEQEIVTRAQAHGAVVSFENFRTTRLNLLAKKTTVVFPRIFSSIILDSLQVTPHLASLLTLSPRISSSGSLYGGSFSIEAVWHDLPAPVGRYQVSAADISLAEHPQLLALGVSAGSLSGEVQVDSSQKQPLSSFTIDIRDIEKPLQSILPASVTGLPINLTIPPSHGLSVLVKGQRAVDGSVSGSIELSSSLLMIKSLGELRLGQQVIEGELAFDITDEGMPFISPLVQLASSDAIAATSRSFHMQFRGNRKHPQLRFISSKNELIDG